MVGKPDLGGPEQSVLAGGTLTFLPGESVKTLAAPLPSGPLPAVVRIALLPPVNAEVTGQDVWFFNTPALPVEPALAKAAPEWNYYANRGPAPAAQRPPADAANLAWTAPAYAMNAAWKTGKTAPLGWGNLGAATPFLPLGTTLPDAEKGITTYFRRNFTVTDPSLVRSLKLELLSDDGAVAFINGVAFPPVNLNPGTDPGGISSIASDKLSTVTKNDSSAEVTYDILTADSSILSALVAGVNVLAVEVHQGSATSGDMVCDAALTLTLNPPGSAAFGLFQLDRAPWLYWDDPALVLESSPDLNQWFPQPGAARPFAIQQEESRRFYRVRR